jgi:basic membrane protein A
MAVSARVAQAVLSAGTDPMTVREFKFKVNISADFGIKSEESTPVAQDGSDRPDRLKTVINNGNGLIIGVGFAQAPIMNDVAHDYPDLNFAIIDGVIDMPNVASLIFKEHEGSFLVGMIAARTTKTGKIGFVGGMDIPLIHKFEIGYAEGARYANPKIEVFDNYVGVTDAAWNNPGKGKEIALAQINKGADVIFTAAGNSGLGAFDAVEQAGKDSSGRATHFVIGVDSNQNMVKPGFVLTSMVKRDGPGTALPSTIRVNV